MLRRSYLAIVMVCQIIIGCDATSSLSSESKDIGVINTDSKTNAVIFYDAQTQTVNAWSCLPPFVQPLSRSACNAGAKHKISWEDFSLHLLSAFAPDTPYSRDSLQVQIAHIDAELRTTDIGSFRYLELQKDKKNLTFVVGILNNLFSGHDFTYSSDSMVYSVLVEVAGLKLDLDPRPIGPDFPYSIYRSLAIEKWFDAAHADTPLKIAPDAVIVQISGGTTLTSPSEPSAFCNLGIVKSPSDPNGDNIIKIANGMLIDFPSSKKAGLEYGHKPVVLNSMDSEGADALYASFPARSGEGPWSDQAPYPLSVSMKCSSKTKHGETIISPRQLSAIFKNRADNF